MLLTNINVIKKYVCYKYCIIFLLYIKLHFVLQALTKLHHENVVALYDCKVRPSLIKLYIMIKMFN